MEINIGGPRRRRSSCGSHGPYHTIITARFYSRTEVQSEISRPIIADVAKAAADELRATWGPFVGEAGTYEVSGDAITMRPLASKSPAVMALGPFVVSTFKLGGTFLWIA